MIENIKNPGIRNKTSLCVEKLGGGVKGCNQCIQAFTAIRVRQKSGKIPVNGILSDFFS